MLNISGDLGNRSEAAVNLVNVKLRRLSVNVNQVSYRSLMSPQCIIKCWAVAQELPSPSFPHGIEESTATELFQLSEK
jgi:hypothetical protein